MLIDEENVHLPSVVTTVLGQTYTAPKIWDEDREKTQQQERLRRRFLFQTTTPPTKTATTTQASRTAVPQPTNKKDKGETSMDIGIGTVVVGSEAAPPPPPPSSSSYFVVPSFRQGLVTVGRKRHPGEFLKVSSDREDASAASSSLRPSSCPHRHAGLASKKSTDGCLGVPPHLVDHSAACLQDWWSPETHSTPRSKDVGGGNVCGERQLFPPGPKQYTKRRVNPTTVSVAVGVRRTQASEAEDDLKQRPPLQRKVDGGGVYYAEEVDIISGEQKVLQLPVTQQALWSSCNEQQQQPTKDMMGGNDQQRNGSTPQTGDGPTSTSGAPLLELKWKWLRREDRLNRFTETKARRDRRDNLASRQKFTHSSMHATKSTTLLKATNSERKDTYERLVNEDLDEIDPTTGRRYMHRVPKPPTSTLISSARQAELKKFVDQQFCQGQESFHPCAANGHQKKKRAVDSAPQQDSTLRPAPPPQQHPTGEQRVPLKHHATDRPTSSSLANKLHLSKRIKKKIAEMVSFFEKKSSVKESPEEVKRA